MSSIAPKTARWFWLLAWLALLGLLTLYFTRQQAPRVSADGALLLARDASGHYRLEGAINGQPVQLMLDTGATLISLPQAVAERIGIPPWGQTWVETAGGRVKVATGRIDSLELGPLTLYDLAVFINPAQQGQTVLVGMNALGRLELIQKERQLLLRPMQE